MTPSSSPTVLTQCPLTQKTATEQSSLGSDLLTKYAYGTLTFQVSHGHRHTVLGRNTQKYLTQERWNLMNSHRQSRWINQDLKFLSRYHTAVDFTGRSVSQFLLGRSFIRIS